MGGFLLIAAAIVGGALAANALLNVLGRSGGPIFVVATFAVVGAGAYAAAFVFDLITLAWAGELPPVEVVWPCITWSLISCFSLAVGAGRPAPFAARAAPFWLVGGLAMLSSSVHPRNLVAALALILFGGIAYPTFAAKWGGKQAGTVEGGGEAKVRRGVAPKIGPYRLGMKTSEASTLVELTPAEKKALNAAIEFRNEKTFRAPSAEFAGATWDMIVGAVDDHVYKLSALLVSESREQRDGKWRNLDETLRTRLGAPATTAATILAWDTEDGNVVLNRAEAGGAYVVVLTLTSRAVSGFVRVK